MSIASEITRINNAKSDIKSYIEAKDVTVSSSDKIDDYADIIEAGFADYEKLISEDTQLQFFTSSLPTSTRMPFICYGDGKYVAVNVSGNSVYSTDGINWTETTLPVTSVIALCYGNGIFIALSYSTSSFDSTSPVSFAAYSIDGINWSKVLLPYSSDWYSICYGNGKFVALNLAFSAWSTDGINWTSSSIPGELNRWTYICYGDGKYVAVNTNSNSACSTDGINWTLGNLPFSGASSICYGNGKFIVPDYTRVAYSIDGINWDRVEVPSNAETVYACYGNGKFVCMPEDYSYCKPVYSTDGINWNIFNLPTLPEDDTIGHIFYCKDKFIASLNNNTTRLVSYNKYTIQGEPSEIDYPCYTGE